MAHKAFGICCIFLLLLAVACTQEPAPQQEQTPTPEQEQQAPGTEETQAPEEQAPEQETPEQEQPSEKVPAENEAVRSELSAQFEKQGTIKYQVAYDMVSQTDNQKTEAEMVQYIDGIDRLRIDMETQGIEIQTFKIDDTYTSCTKFSGSWSCNQLEYEQSETDMMREQAEQDIQQQEVSQLPGRTIAGAQAECYRVIVDNGMVDYCYSGDGVPLYIRMEGESDGHTTMAELTATSYSLNVPASVFEFPAEPKQMGESGGAGGYDQAAYEDMAKQYGYG